ncbi:MerR family transcriptional regulator [Leuconostoc suionicum]|uniref:MerR family transcriptional regulator n=1 Tax=Leuconostoc suionicum TaxID=1511761 RepID=UPI003749BA98
MKQLTRGKLAKMTGLSAATIRYYEQCGLLPKPKRLANGYRVYDETYLPKIKFIQDAKSLGYTLKEIQESLNMLNKQMSPDDLKKLVADKITQIESRIDNLITMKKLLMSLLEFSDSDIYNYLSTF